MIRASIVFYACLAAVLWNGYSSGADGPPVRSFTNMAHRGASHLAPENTIAAFRLAAQAGAEAMECDVHPTVDGALVLSHDRTLKRTLGIDRDVTTSTLEELRELDAGSWKNEKYKGEKITTLDEYLEFVRDTKTFPVIEAKVPGIEERIVEAVRKWGLVDVATIDSFSVDVAKKIRKLEPRICVPCIYVESVKERPEDHVDRLYDTLRKRCGEIDTTVVWIEHRLLCKELVAKLRASGFRVWAWVVNDAQRMNTLLDWDVDCMTTDRPELLAEVLEKRKATRPE